MGFLDKAKAAATDLAAKADSALQSAGAGGPRPADADRWLRDLGLLTYLEATGRPVDAAEQARVMAGLREIDAAGGLRSHALHTAPPPAPGMAPPPPGSASAPPPPGGSTAGGSTPPPPPGASAPPPPPGAATPPAPGPGAPSAPDPAPATTPGPAATPPPPPTWAGGDDTPRSP